MRTRKLGNSDLHLTTVGLGAWAMGGGGWDWGWGPQDDADSIATIHRAIDLGVNWIDTAPVYGFGRSEAIVGRALAGIRDEVTIATKCGLVWDDQKNASYSRLKAASIRSELEASLKHLNTDYVDLYQIHWPNPDEDIEEAWGAIADLIREGKIRYAGVSNFRVEQIERLQAIHPVTSLQPPYSMLRRGIERKLLPFCATNNIGVIVYSPLQAGLLTGKFTRERWERLPEDDWRRRAPHFQEPSFSANLELAEALRPIAERVGCTRAQLAIAWVLNHPAVTSAIVGARRPDQIAETAPGGDVDLSADDVAEVDALLRAIPAAS